MNDDFIMPADKVEPYKQKKVLFKKKEKSFKQKKDKDPWGPKKDWEDWLKTFESVLYKLSFIFAILTVILYIVQLVTGQGWQPVWWTYSSLIIAAALIIAGLFTNTGRHAYYRVVKHVWNFFKGLLTDIKKLGK